MLENIITSKTRIKILKLFLANINDRYYLRELERMLEESLSPLRRQLLKLAKMGILSIEYEGNLKFYRLNRNFSGIEELRKLVLGKDFIASEPKQSDGVIARTKSEAISEIASVASSAGAPRNDMPAPQPQEFSTRSNNKRIKYDIAVLTFVSIFVLATSAFVVYTSTKNLKQVAGLVSEKTLQAPVVVSSKEATATRPDEMVSRRWKLLPGNVPVLSSGETGGEKRSKEL